MGRTKIYFKYNFKEYYQQYHDGSLLLWCGCTKTRETFYLGCFKDNRIEISASLIKKDWDIQDGSRRLFKVILDKYFDKKYKNTKVSELQDVGKNAIVFPWQIN